MFVSKLDTNQPLVRRETMAPTIMKTTETRRRLRFALTLSLLFTIPTLHAIEGRGDRVSNRAASSSQHQQYPLHTLDRELNENEGILKVFTTAWKDVTAAESSSTQSDITKCRHPDTGDTVYLTCWDGSSIYSKAPKSATSKAPKSPSTKAPSSSSKAPKYASSKAPKMSKKGVTCSPTSAPSTESPTTSSPTTSPTTASPTNMPVVPPTSSPTRTQSPTGKKGTGFSTKKKDKSSSSPNGSHQKTSKNGSTGSPKYAKTKYNYVDLELPVCTSDQLGTSGDDDDDDDDDNDPDNNQSPPAPTTSPIGVTVTTPDDNPIPTPSPANTLVPYCDRIASGSGTPEVHSTAFQLDGTYFATSALGDSQYSRLRALLQQGVAPLTVQCPVDINSILSNNRALRSLMNEDIATIKVGEFEETQTGTGAACGPPSPNPGDFCSNGSITVVASAQDEASLDGYANLFIQTMFQNLSPAILAELGLTGLQPSGFQIIDTGGGGGGDDDGPGGGGDDGSGGEDDTNTGQTGDTQGGDDEEEDNTRGGTNNVAAAQSNEPVGKRTLKPGPIVAVVFAGLALCVVIVVAANRKRYPSIAEALKHKQMQLDDDDCTSLFADEASATSSQKKFAQVIGDSDGNSWQGSRDLHTPPPVYSTPVDQSGFPALIDTARDTGGEQLVFELHPPDEICSSPTCQQCEKRRQQSTVRFIPLSKNQKSRLGPPANRRLAERNYVADDTVEL